MATRLNAIQDMGQDAYLPHTLDVNLSAARSGDPQAYYELGLMFSTGEGVELDLVEAHKWFNLAVIKGIESAKIYRAELASEMSTEDISAAQKSAREWLAESLLTH